MLWPVAIAAGAAGGLAVRMAYEAFRTAVVKEDVFLPRLPASFDGTRIFFISDLHRRTVPPKLIRSVEEAGGADLVLVGGDIREKGVPLERTGRNLRALSELGPVYAVYGNNDYDDRIRELDVLLREERVKVLANESVLLEQADGSRFRLAGIDDAKSRRDRVKAALADPVDGGGGFDGVFTLLLAHDPAIADKLTADTAGKIDLILSGHTHGGQIVLPFTGGWHPVKAARRYRSGWFALARHKQTGEHAPRLFVSCGFGTTGLPLRFMAPSESHLFILRSGASGRR
ncbi:metallophosphoesterase [uncultured Paenibacillus sp.]|uniref:metallophosphoesterase n=1 Tax=uncultured Paenibacillus sp. TaxID=227322 RepID=UPI0028D1A43C|nr:metallophosphoesterase [uncultured Paenibacillus sp.]